MLLIITCGALAVIGLLLCVQCWRLGDVMFSKEAIYKEKRFDDETLRFKRGGRAGHLLPDSWKDQRRVRKAWMR